MVRNPKQICDDLCSRKTVNNDNVSNTSIWLHVLAAFLFSSLLSLYDKLKESQIDNAIG